MRIASPPQRFKQPENRAQGTEKREQVLARVPWGPFQSSLGTISFDLRLPEGGEGNLP